MFAGIILPSSAASSLDGPGNDLRSISAEGGTEFTVILELFVCCCNGGG
jgi:hypothetical protein